MLAAELDLVHIGVGESSLLNVQPPSWCQVPATMRLGTGRGRPVESVSWTGSPIHDWTSASSIDVPAQPAGSRVSSLRLRQSTRVIRAHRPDSEVPAAWLTAGSAPCGMD